MQAEHSVKTYCLTSSERPSKTDLLSAPGNQHKRTFHCGARGTVPPRLPARRGRLAAIAALPLLGCADPSIRAGRRPILGRIYAAAAGDCLVAANILGRFLTFTASPFELVVAGPGYWSRSNDVLDTRSMASKGLPATPRSARDL